MNQNILETLIKKAEESNLTPSEKLTLVRELKAKLEQYNKVLKAALAEFPD
jgi:hypothetical protein